MKRNTIKWRILKYNLIAIVLFISITAFVFNFVIGLYIKSDVYLQLNNALIKLSDRAQNKGPHMFGKHDFFLKEPPKDTDNFYRLLDMTLFESLGSTNAKYLLFTVDNTPDFNNTRLAPIPKIGVVKAIRYILTGINNSHEKKEFTFSVDGVDYVGVTFPLNKLKEYGYGCIVVYADLEKSKDLQLKINFILFAILILSAVLISIISSITAKKISAPFTSLNKHISEISDRNFNKKLRMPVDDELQEFVNNINIMSEKLETHDKAQKTFLQNASHEFRTPLMSIQSYAEGIKYDVVDSKNAADIIIDETKRMTTLVEDLLYLSRLDTIEENYKFIDLDFSDFICGCVDRMEGIATKHNVKITINRIPNNVLVSIDEEKLSRAIVNILSNCIRYAKKILSVNANIIDRKNIELIISDDGPGFEDIDFENIFERFHKGKNGKFGLGLSISKNVIVKHSGSITAEKSKLGAVFKIVLPIINDIALPNYHDYEYLK